MMKLLINGVEAVKGQEVTDFRGESWTLEGWQEPHKPSSTGRVYVSQDGAEFQREFFPGVVGGGFINE